MPAYYSSVNATPGGSSPERRLTARTLTPLLSGARSTKLIEAGLRNTAPNRRLVSGGLLQRRQQKDERLILDSTYRLSGVILTVSTE